jgi:hypothetical protein
MLYFFMKVQYFIRRECSFTLNISVMDKIFKPIVVYKTLYKILQGGEVLD